MGEPYFVFKDISSKDMGVLVNVLPPITRAPRDINKIIIPGRDGYLTEDYATYGSIVKTCECTLLDIAMVNEILPWLDGCGEVIFSNQLDRKYEVCIINKIPFDRIMWQWYKFIVIFDSQPFALTLANAVQTLNVPGTILNIGTTKSKPIIKVYGTGAIDLSVNGNVIHLTNVVGYVTIDSDLMDCYKDTVLKNSDMSGDFPELNTGANAISWTGTVSYVDITLNGRFL